MPGPKMGVRPVDFDEELVRHSPTFRKWEALLPGAKLRYACREFVKGHGEDEERLMRRIMIARRNNVRDHQALKWARRMQTSDTVKGATAKAAPNVKQSSPSQAQNNSSTAAGVGNKYERKDHRAAVKEEEISGGGGRDSNASNSRIETEEIISRTSHLLEQELEVPPGRRTRRPTTLISDDTIKEEMDFPAVEGTRSYKMWLSLPDGAEFLYNQKYIKGHETHDWLLKKNIWRRMRYRRENKKMVEDMLSRERKGTPLSIVSLRQESLRKRKHDETTIGNDTSATASISTAINADRDIGRVIVDAVVAQSGAEDAATNETNRQEVVASTASEIVDHALLSTNTGVVVAATAGPSMVSDANTKGTNNIAISIGDHQQQHQNPSPHSLHQHHHDPGESAAAFAASIALARSVADVNGIGTHGDLTSHQVADSAAVEAAVAAALAATDAKSNSYHHHAGDLVDINHVIHGTNDPLESGTATGGISVGPGLSSAAGSSMTPTSATAASRSTPASGDVDLGLALDAAAKLAAAVVVSSSEEVVLAATTAINTGGPESKEGSNMDVDKVEV
uniref:Uncharacterized protein n=1 Tax=Pseudo-nitzschia australis TaxID=44445 RepID=A0A6U9YXC4_9STRA|mmetsp:Transcript_17173/g.37566  ORF Transcript_17173/g.37566 Transcript_17173/m.37566 type:complete len:566 (-) Transcript_17173:253-1950(-)